jgi:hypothetical protein
MDCSTARLFLQLGRPGAPRDLDGDEAAELEAHLGHCNTCHQLDLDQRRLDDTLGRAMRDVEVPRGLKEQIQLRLAAEQGARQRRWGGRVFLVAGLAAASVLLAWGLWVLVSPLRPTIAAEAVVHDYNVLRPEKTKSDEQLKSLDLRACAPTFTNYAFLIGAPSSALLPGTEGWPKPVKAAQFVFAHEGHRAVVYAVPRREANVERPETIDQGYPYSLDYVHDPRNPPLVYLVLHTGKDWKWLKVQTPEEE